MLAREEGGDLRGVRRALRGSFWLMAMVTGSSIGSVAFAQEGEGEMAVTTSVSDDLSFGTVTIPASGTCRYAVSPTGTNAATGGPDCVFSDGFVNPARFEVACAPFALIQVDVAAVGLATQGILLEGAADPLALDGGAAGPATQVRPCDSDGRTDAAVGGVLVVASDAPEELSDRVGTIRIEVIYN